ncbi:hypothetical protein ACOME3_002745 [Neoechinorhynchus agilis]
MFFCLNKRTNSVKATPQKVNALLSLASVIATEMHISSLQSILFLGILAPRTAFSTFGEQTEHSISDGVTTVNSTEKNTIHSELLYLANNLFNINAFLNLSEGSELPINAIVADWLHGFNRNMLPELVGRVNEVLSTFDVGTLFQDISRFFCLYKDADQSDAATEVSLSKRSEPQNTKNAKSIIGKVITLGYEILEKDNITSRNYDEESTHVKPLSIRKGIKHFEQMMEDLYYEVKEFIESNIDFCYLERAEAIKRLLLKINDVSEARKRNGDGTIQLNEYEIQEISKSFLPILYCLRRNDAPALRKILASLEHRLKRK